MTDSAPDPHSVPDMVKVALTALAEWRGAKVGSAPERHAARRLAWAVGRLEALGVLDAAAAHNG